ncbi:hypothetical protein TorRG33x02_119430, partial [Trema orientale]
MIREDRESDINVAENKELASLFDESITALGEGDMGTALVLDWLKLHHLPPHPASKFQPSCTLPTSEGEDEQMNWVW